MIHIRLNGQHQTISEEISLTQLLTQLRLNPLQIAVAVNLEVVPRSELDLKKMREGDEIEIFQAVGGG